MTHLYLAHLHLGTVLPAFVLGTYLMLNRKGTRTHKLLGKIYLAFMFITASITLFIKAQVGPQFLGHFGFIHLLCLSVIIGVPMAYFTIKNGEVKKHKMHMINLYVFGLLVAGTFALMPGRLLHKLLFDQN